MPESEILYAALKPIFFNEIAYVVYAAVFAYSALNVLMRPQRFYFIRHGETLLNAQHIRQGPEGGLSERGKEQADRVGAYLERLPIKRIISSTYPRALETSEIINKHFDVKVVATPLLAERRNPSEIIGKSTKDPEVTRIVDEMDLAYHDDDYRFSDEENFADMKARARKALSFLIRRGTHETIVVTHHHFLKMLVAHMLYPTRLHAGDFVKLSFFNYSDNAGVTICEFHPWSFFSRTRGWEVISFNERPAGE